MKVIQKFQSAIAEGEALDWATLHMLLDAEHAAASTTRERENLLSLFTVMMDMVEHIDTTPETLADFRDDRRRSYHRLLLREACVDGRLCGMTLHDVTAREVQNGRMLQDDPLRLSAIQAFADLTERTARMQASRSGAASQPATLSEPAAGLRQRVVLWWAARLERLSAAWHSAPQNRTV